MNTGTKRLHADALADAIAFQDLFPNFAAKWEIAGSVRRNKPEVGDIEHVVMPLNVERFWARVEELTRDEGSMFQQAGVVFEKAIYSDGSHRWGEKYRGIMFRGFRHEVFIANADNWGAILAIRTGPAEFSKMLVTSLPHNGYRQDKGFVMEGMTRVAVPTEQEFLRMCGCRWIEPQNRGATP